MNWSKKAPSAIARGQDPQQARAKIQPLAAFRALRVGQEKGITVLMVSNHVARCVEL
jgi:hypothetical protein